ncbi:MAG: 5,10-methenyltetrahydromethanopterin hydrogenase [Methanothermobacter sp.]|jgi:5,10-methenyltetrahydromethanopterin hydrogenase|uniref:5,10-methenyltetrahydromethanopterin hydrogenase n=1 Tax=Methanothermobacter thermautotrophicus (strain ATCC 29096 / DSM 1053 / JCM 10044 / NBRC 100330 / Delta H) TaxID=187420 RepID=HMD_METTH|nr:5,10-methenyltetrahydromethanopterin hydrogenase [Methanothermobacter thermautotrophicus]O27211.2 RecName: Full=5,10-methenyltetrahydromethanopterin hydrogenase; AltName: Full=H(2)-dependent methylene-H(4)MPT dehydrogenase; AltName: Full=H(2)-forming N(5),N(10)-methylenetetrahydromethanopterin dehydrogenase; AltName: Full=N(5),N(10)-methenyltetrahydromethanopterin hydrogenase [Methanothermobacter thermautotrophicus str. Delta H]AAA87423.1 H2-dependent methylene-H4MPT dehydrogenase [Methanother
MKLAILGAGCYRTHAASGITNFSRACEVAEMVGKPEIAMTHSTITMGAELKELAGVDEVVVADPVFDNQFTVIDDFAYEDVIEAHKEDPEKIMPQIREKVNEVAKELPKPPEGAIHFTHPEDLGFEITTDDREAVADADFIMTWFPKGDMQPGIIDKFIDDIKPGAIVTHACTIPTTKFYKIFEEKHGDLVTKPETLNVTSYHPGAVPEMKGQVYIAEGYASEEAINTLFELGQKARGNAYRLPAELLGPVCDMCSALTAITYAGILSYRDSVTQVLGAPAGFAQMMAKESLEQITALMEKVGIDKMEEHLDPGALLGTADSMNFGASADILPTVFEILEKRKK